MSIRIVSNYHKFESIQSLLKRAQECFQVSSSKIVTLIAEIVQNFQNCRSVVLHMMSTEKKAGRMNYTHVVKSEKNKYAH